MLAEAARSASAGVGPAASSAPTRSARSCRARSERADNVTTFTVRSGPEAAGSDGGSPTTTWALVPLNPNELTPANRPATGLGQGVGSVGTAIAGAVAAMCGLSRRRWRCGGTMPCRSMSTALMSPATPAAASVWPRLVFTDPTRSGSPASRCPHRAALSAPSSIGSPSSVPVPWAST